ncbi:uncharacterized protein N7482_007884 [Penicillium canariense]|uniref:Uncharacterized protein n=1 Tax=Penicillium canariense TaxID=189055 RepID=A0A9W9LK93_9EURO|nr:uncharacterized protein N7482_007884 [Penicillium canariense]KAJ5160880.1 hypothetical protein N7482_007884 [Penicillium canariense]
MGDQMDYHPTPLGNWLEDLFNKLFYQPDDGLSKKAMEEGLSPQLKISINGQNVPKEAYDQVIAETRRTYNISVQSSRELLASSDATDNGIGSVAHIQTFILEDKKTGTQRKQTSLTISVIASSDGGKQLIELTEVMLDH